MPSAISLKRASTIAEIRSQQRLAMFERRLALYAALSPMRVGRER